MSKLIKNMARCLLCGDTIESKHRHDLVRCTCRNLFVDGGLDYARRGYTEEAWEELSEYKERPCKGRNSNVCVAEGCYGEDCIE